MGKSGTHFTELNNELRKQQQKKKKCDSSLFALCADVCTPSFRHRLMFMSERLSSTGLMGFDIPTQPKQFCKNHSSIIMYGASLQDYSADDPRHLYREGFKKRV